MIYSAYSSSSVCLSVSIMENCSRDASTFCRQPDCGLRGTLKISIDNGIRLCYICPKHKDIIRWGDEKGINCAGRTGKDTGKKDEPASENHNLNRTLRKKFCKGSGAMWYTYLINIHSTETTEQQHIIHKQEDCPNSRRIVSQKIVTTCSHFPSSLREGVLKKHMSGGSNAVKAL
jgi:hypothetical protein